MLVCGESVCTEGGLDRIRPQIGVCPQFDVLWGELTGLEHLVISGHVKGLPFTQVCRAVAGYGISLLPCGPQAPKGRDLS